MNIFEVGLIGIGLAMDAFSVSICKGISMKKIDLKKTAIISIYFGFFQFIMPIIGFLLGSSFEEIVKNLDHWIAFILLGIIGINMMKEAFDDKINNTNNRIDFKTMIFLAIATSIDALAVGITFAFYNVNIIISSLFIGIITFALACFGVKLGFEFGNKYKNKAELIGGIILVLIGFKILVGDLNF